MKTILVMTNYDKNYASTIRNQSLVLTAVNEPQRGWALSDYRLVAGVPLCVTFQICFPMVRTRWYGHVTTKMFECIANQIFLAKRLRLRTRTAPLLRQDAFI